MAMEFDASRARLKAPDVFWRFRVPDQGTPLASAGLGADEHVLIVERGGEARALSAADMHYHHAAQGTLAGEPYLVSF